MNLSKSLPSLPVVYAILSVLVTIISFPEQISSAPTTKNVTEIKNQTFMGQMLNHIKTENCIFPIQQSEIDEKTAAYKKINYLCNASSPKAEKIHVPSPTENLCVAVADVVYKVCNKTKGFQASNKDADLSLPFQEVGDEDEITSFCGKLFSEAPETSDLPVQLTPFFGNFLVNQPEEESSYCGTICKNLPTTPVIEGDDKIKISPLCLLFKRGYDVLKKLTPEDNVAIAAPETEAVKETDKTTVSKPAEKLSQPSSVSGSPVLANKASSNKPQFGKPDDVNAKEDELPAADQPQSDPVVPANKTPEANVDKKADDKTKKSSSISSSTTPTSAGIGSPDGEVPEPPHADNNINKQNSPVPSQPSSFSDKKDKDTEKTKKPAENTPIETVQEKPEQNSEVVDKAPLKPLDDKNAAHDKNQQKEKVVNEETSDNFDGGAGDSGENLDDDRNVNNLDSNVPLKDDDLTLNYDETKGDNNKKSSKSSNIPVMNTFEESDEGGGFFNYFLFFVTFLALGFIVFHNKRRLIAFVVEGRKPRGGGRTRRRSSASSAASYRRLENNFE